MLATNKKTKSGFVWVFFGTAGQNIVQFAALMVLARLISPEEFGLVSAAMIIVGLIGIFSELGVGPAIVQKPKLTKEDVATGKVISATVGIVMGIAVFYSAGLLERFMRINGLADVVKILAFVIPVSGLTVIGQSLLQRQLKFKIYVICVFSSFFISQIMVAIPLAYMGYGYYSLVIATLAQKITLLTFISFVAQDYGGWSFNIKSARHLSNYGFGQSLGRLANYIASQGDNFIIGRYLGAGSLGLYGRSYQLLMVPTNLIGTVFDKIMFPVMSSIQDDDKKLVEMYVLSMSIIAMISIPIIAFFFTSSEEIITLLLGKDWLESAPILKILICVLFFRVSYKVSDSLSKAKGSVYRRAWRQAFYALIVLLCTYIGHFYGLEGVAYGVVVSITLNYLIMLHLSKSLIALEYSSIFYLLIKNSMVLLIIIGLVTLIDSRNNVSQITVLVLNGFLSISLSLLVFILAKKYYIDEIKFVVSFFKGK